MSAPLASTRPRNVSGIGASSDGKQVFHEGLFIPLLPLARQGVLDESVLRIIRANVREPVQVEGDVFALMACNETGERRLSAMLRETILFRTSAGFASAARSASSSPGSK